MMQLVKIYLIILVVLISGCEGVPGNKESRELFSLEQYKAEHDLVGSEEYKLGIALSGGGLRSSLFAYGALKALYDAGILQNVDVISSVSGGGYTAYAIFTAKDKSHFGESIFQAEKYLEETCRLITAGNFIQPQNIFSDGLSVNPKAEAIALYEQSIGRTYGRSDQDRRLMQVHNLAQAAAQKKKPFWIINTTVSNPNPSDWSDGLFEFTPLWMGNDAYGYRKFGVTDSFELRKAIAISGAAFAPLLEQKIAVSLPNYNGSSITLSDGGHSENLGAIALIKRGVKNIIIIDAEHDPNYSFGGYFNLKSELSHFDSDFKIKEIEKIVNSGVRLKNGLYEGEIKAHFKEGETISKIYYLKMGIPESLDETILDGKLNSRGRLTNTDYFKILSESKGADGSWDCSATKDFNADLKAWYSYSISSYSDYLNYENYVRHADKLPGDFFTSKFPQYTTIDQSFYLDQALAFIGLGYLEAQEIVYNNNIRTISEGLQGSNR